MKTALQLAGEMADRMGWNPDAIPELAKELEPLLAENARLRAAIIDYTGELTPEQLERHEAWPPLETSQPNFAALYRAAKS